MTELLSYSRSILQLDKLLQVEPSSSRGCATYLREVVLRLVGRHDAIHLVITIQARLLHHYELLEKHRLPIVGVSVLVLVREALLLRYSMLQLLTKLGHHIWWDLLECIVNIILRNLSSCHSSSPFGIFSVRRKTTQCIIFIIRAAGTTHHLLAASHRPTNILARVEGVGKRVILGGRLLLGSLQGLHGTHNIWRSIREPSIPSYLSLLS